MATEITAKYAAIEKETVEASSTPAIPSYSVSFENTSVGSRDGDDEAGAAAGFISITTGAGTGAGELPVPVEEQSPSS